MKTPREILFQRHESTSPQLDAIRQEVITRHCGPARRDQVGSYAGRLARLGRELFWPCRRIWTGLATVWLLLVIINLSQRDGATNRLAKAPPTPQMMVALRQQEEMLDALLADRTPPAEAIPPRNFEPKPRSEISGITAV